MIRKIIEINRKKCNGCGACAKACHEGAIQMINGKAELVRDDYCDGLGNCLPVCPVNAISFVEREAAPFNEKAVNKHLAKSITPQQSNKKLPCGCPGTYSKKINRENTENTSNLYIPSRLSQWPVQIKLVPVNAPYFNSANLLIAADCTAYAYGNFHNEFIKNRITVIGCPKLDEGDYTEKLTAVFQNNNIENITVVRMEVPCCGGIEKAAVNALKASGKSIPLKVVTISADGRIIE